MEKPFVLTPGILILSLESYRSQRNCINDQIVEQARRGSVWVLDAGNGITPYQLARKIRQQTPVIQPILNRIQIARAFTCFQVVTLLSQTHKPQGAIFILDLLATFADEIIPAQSRNFLLRQVLAQIARLQRSAAVFLTLGRPDTLDLMPSAMLQQLRQRASRVFSPGVLVPPETPRLF